MLWRWQKPPARNQATVPQSSFITFFKFYNVLRNVLNNIWCHICLVIMKKWILLQCQAHGNNFLLCICGVVKMDYRSAMVCCPQFKKLLSRAWRCVVWSTGMNIAVEHAASYSSE
jgi:hypothetical protein